MAVKLKSKRLFFICIVQWKDWISYLKPGSLDFENKDILMNWCHKTPKFKNYNSEILRSAMTPKLLTFEKTGAFAAATTSLSKQKLEMGLQILLDQRCIYGN